MRRLARQARRCSAAAEQASAGPDARHSPVSALWRRAPPQYLDFSKPQRFPMLALGMLPEKAAAAADHQGPLAARKVGFSEFLTLASIPVAVKDDVDNAVHTGAGPEGWRHLTAAETRESVEKMELALELRPEGEMPHVTMLQLVAADPSFRLSSDAVALVIREFNRIAEVEADVGAASELALWTRAVYPTFCFVVGSLGMRPGTSLLRSMEHYLNRARERGELSANFAGYHIERLLKNVQVWRRYGQMVHRICAGNYLAALDRTHGDLDFLLFSNLTQHIPGFHDMFPRQKPVLFGDFIKEMKTYEAVYVLHSSYLLQPEHENDTRGVLGRLKELLDVVVGDDDDEVLLVPHWTLHQLLEGALDAPDDVAEATKKLLLAMSSEKSAKVRFVWPSELIIPCVQSRSIQQTLTNNTDRILALASYLSEAVPSWTKKNQKEQDDRIEAAKVALERAELFGTSKNERTRMRLGLGGRVRKMERYSDVALEPEPQQGVILLTHSSQMRAQATALGMWAEPGDKVRGTADRRKLRKTQWFKFPSAVLQGHRQLRRKQYLAALAIRKRRQANRASRRAGAAARRGVARRPRTEKRHGPLAGGSAGFAEGQL